MQFVVLPPCSHDIILSWDFLSHQLAIIDCAHAEVVFCPLGDALPDCLFFSPLVPFSTISLRMPQVRGSFKDHERTRRTSFTFSVERGKLICFLFFYLSVSIVLHSISYSLQKKKRIYKKGPRLCAFLASMYFCGSLPPCTEHQLCLATSCVLNGLL